MPAELIHIISGSICANCTVLKAHLIDSRVAKGEIISIQAQCIQNNLVPCKRKQYSSGNLDLDLEYV